MAEAVVSVLGKLADVIASEAQFLGEVGKKVERVQRELIRIKCCLIDADSKRNKGDERVQNWLNELRDLAYRIEDATDTFFLEVEGHRQEDANILRNPIKKMCNKRRKLDFRHKLGNQLDDIQNLLEEISKSRVTYGIRDLPLENQSKRKAVRMPLRRATYSEVDENEVVGLQSDNEIILKLLRPEKTSRRTVITIVGAGGLGKTTLACMVYKSAQADFDYHKMLSISQQYSLTGLLRKMISNSEPNDRDEDYYVHELKRCLHGRRYLIILDDVWTGDLWNELKEILPDDKNGSRVLMTTRLVEVAKSADSEIPPYKLNLLNEGESLDLLLKKIFPYKKPNEECPKDLLELAPELSNKCKGLPLALIVLGGILATKELAYPAWERVLRTMNWHSDGSSCMQILAMSYDDMPYYLKACFQYLACFPEDYVISAKRLIGMWVAEGFIPLEGTTTMEILAEGCLEELAERSIIQVLSRYSVNGLIKRFKVHDILHELAMHEARHENFVTVFSHASNETKPNRIIRRASLQAKEKNSQFIKYVGRNTRSLLLFGPPEYYETGLHCSNFRLLKVVEIFGDLLSQLELKSLDELIHLKYLGIRYYEIDLSSCSLNRMRSLQTLDVRGSRGKQPCDDFWSIGTLRHVRGSWLVFWRPLPKCIDLNNLQTLKSVRVERSCDWKLPNLRKLGFSNGSDEWVSIINLLETLPLLVSLSINGKDLPMEIVYPKALPNYQNLQSLILAGEWHENVNVEARLFPPHLVELVLYKSGLKQNPMPELGKLNSLKKLCLEGKVLSSGWEDPIICPEGFPILQYLQVIYQESNIKDLTVAQGVMPKLTYIKVDSTIEVHLPPELQHATVEKW